MFDRSLADYFEPSDTAQSRALIDRVCASSRAENRAAADRLDAIGQLFELRRIERGERKDWAVDTWAAVSADVAAALRISLGLADSVLHYALAMRERLPQVGEVFRAGDIDYRLFQTIVYRTDLITDVDALATVDGQLAVKVSRWPSMTRGKLAGEIDRIVARVDRDAVRRAKERVRDRELVIWETSHDGMADVAGSMFATDAKALDAKLDALAATVCADDPRSHDQRRADALGALAAGADRLGCRCGDSDCCAGGTPASNVVIHVIADQATVEGRGDSQGSMLGSDGLIPAELVAELAKTAKLRPLFDPADAAPEPSYQPSAKLADFVRCRDLTWRAPGCDQAAMYYCDIDHTIPYVVGGLTHALNLKCLCNPATQSQAHDSAVRVWG